MTRQMRRRDVIALVGSTAATMIRPLAARAQPTSMPVIGYLGSRSSQADAAILAMIRQGLRETGYVEGRDVAFEYSWADGEYGRLAALAADLVRRKVTVIVTSGGSNPAVIAKQATSTIPIVFAGGGGGDPVRTGLVASLNRPGGNVTGVTNFGVELDPKRLEILRESVPQAGLIAVLVNPTGGRNKGTQLRDLQKAAAAIGQPITVLQAGNENELDAAFAKMSQQRAGALLVAVDPFFLTQTKKLAALAIRYALPAIYFRREFVVAGGLMSYGADYADGYRQAGVYVGRILKGEHPADLPVVQPTRFELVVNTKAAKAIGLKIPESFLLRADEVIE